MTTRPVISIIRKVPGVVLLSLFYVFNKEQTRRLGIIKINFASALGLQFILQVKSLLYLCSTTPGAYVVFVLSGRVVTTFLHTRLNKVQPSGLEICFVGKFIIYRCQRQGQQKHPTCRDVALARLRA